VRAATLAVGVFGNGKLWEAVSPMPAEVWFSTGSAPSKAGKAELKFAAVGLILLVIVVSCH
jgi:hypothetical protein